MPVQITNVDTPTSGAAGTQQCQTVNVTVNSQWDAPNPRVRVTTGQLCNVSPVPDTVTGATLTAGCYSETVAGAGFTLAWNTGTQPVSFEAAHGTNFFVEDDISPGFEDYWWDVGVWPAPYTQSSRVKGAADDPFVEAVISTGSLQNGTPDQGQVTADGVTTVSLTWNRETPGQDKSDVTVTVDAPATITETDAANGVWEVCRDSAAAGTFNHTVTAVNDIDAATATAPADFTFTGGTGGDTDEGSNPQCLQAAPVAHDSATMNGTADSVDTDRAARFAWGTVSGGPYPNTSSPQPGNNTAAQPFSHSLTGLTPATTYYFRLELVDGAGQPRGVNSLECSFTTIPAPVPTPQSPKQYIETDPRPLPEFRYSDFIEWMNVGDPHWRKGIITEPWSCPLDVHSITDLDCLANNALRDEKPLGPRGVPVVESHPFVLHADYNCSTVPRSYEEAQARAEHRLNISEDLGLSEQVLAMLKASSATILNPVATTELPMLGGIALLQQWLGENVGTNGIIHAPFAVAPYLQNGRQFIWDGMAHRDIQHNRWAFGPFYGTPDSAGPGTAQQPAGTAWLYATSGFYGIRGSTFFTPPSEEGGFDRAKNNLTVIAEREYTLWHECDVAAVLVKVSCCC